MRVVLAVAFALGALVGAPTASAATLLSCPMTITSGGTYVLTGDLICPPSQQIVIETSDAVTIDLQGYTLYGSINVAQRFDPGPNTVLVENGAMTDFLYVGRGKFATVQHVSFEGTPLLDAAVVVVGTVSIADSVFLHLKVRVEPGGFLDLQRSRFFGGGVRVLQAFANVGSSTFLNGSIVMDESAGSIVHNVLIGGSAGISLSTDGLQGSGLLYRVGGNIVIGSSSYEIYADQPVTDLGGNRVAHISAQPPCINVVCMQLT